MWFLRFREPVNTWTHLVTCLAAVVGMVLLIVWSRESAAKVSVMVIYGVSLIVLFMASAVYHAVRSTPEKILALKKFDHMAIYLLIAGTYTPVFAFGLDGAWRITMLAVVWGLALAGMALKLFYINAPRYFSTLLYVGLGWIAVVPFVKLVETLPMGAIWMMLAGGIAYTVGAVIYATKWFDWIPGKFGFHEIFHLWVSAGATLHFLMVARYIAI
ncbi:hemolysin III family channel protein [Tumebacillus avium]|uniref:Hemolysin III family channel protein n=1 Tax=Tumebacillus avium TaxID=1903704 RepID=A0A1Y0INH3_9BACL|nr:hemolysin III family protein [Tumebacillus avium]ARU62057.1 hemolysin III family channel protein [Tumebacillus avium]